MPKLKKRKFLGAKRKYCDNKKKTLEKPEVFYDNQFMYMPGVIEEPTDDEVDSDNRTSSHVDVESDHSFTIKSSPLNMNDGTDGSQTNEPCVISSPFSLLDHNYTYMRMSKIPVARPDQLPKELSKFERLQEDIRNKLCSPYVPVLRDDYIEILELYKAGGKTAIKLAVTFDPTFKATIHVHRKKLAQDHDLWDGLPQSFDTYTKVHLLLDKLKKYVVCKGNPDEEYQDLVPIGSTLTSGNSSEGHAYREGDFWAESGKLRYNSTIRAMKCPMLVEGPRCCSCASYRRCLRTRKQRLAEKADFLDRDLIHSRYKHKDMSRQMLISKIDQQKSCIKNMQHQIDIFHKQRQYIDRELLRRGIRIPDHQNQEMSDLFSVCREDMETEFSRSRKNGMS
ncbi:uncharacterized protein LOC117339835 [Pecten maximus]|uniref:uncharacterized protein LOC117339835 n=1 Tax=Pecten maximus TaxID=6579 RepID=UPI001457EC16|nr:uncharacterized protein LOC117339835 [Pecten maximus]